MLPSKINYKLVTTSSSFTHAVGYRQVVKIQNETISIIQKHLSIETRKRDYYACLPQHSRQYTNV